MNKNLRKAVIAGNWKMNKTPAEATALINEMKPLVAAVWYFSFWLTSLCIIGSSFIHLIRTDSDVFFLMAE